MEFRFINPFGLWKPNYFYLLISDNIEFIKDKELKICEYDRALEKFQSRDPPYWIKDKK